MQNVRTFQTTGMFVLILVISAIFISSCSTTVQIPIPIGESVRLSPVYVVEITNQTSAPLTILSNSTGHGSFEDTIIAPGEALSTFLQIQEVMIGDTPTREVVSCNPYFDSGMLGPDSAYLRYQDSSGSSKELEIDLRSEQWFKPRKTTKVLKQAVPKPLQMNLTDDNLSKKLWFRDGPDMP